MRRNTECGRQSNPIGSERIFLLMAKVFVNLCKTILQSKIEFPPLFFFISSGTLFVL